MKGINKVILISFLSLTASIVIWPELFLFSKVAHLPKWVTYFPHHIIGTYILTLICLLPLLFLSKPTKSLLFMFVKILISSSILGINLAFYLDHGEYTLTNYIANYLGQTAWLLFVIFLAPSLIILILNALIMKRKYNNG